MRPGQRLPVGKPKRKRDATLSRENLFNAAMEECMTPGFDGARIDAIVKRARVSKNPVCNYFGGKKDMVLHVMGRTHKRMRVHHADLWIKGLSPVEGMSELIRDTFAHFWDHLEIISRFNSENVHWAAHIKGSKSIAKL